MAAQKRAVRRVRESLSQTSLESSWVLFHVSYRTYSVCFFVCTCYLLLFYLACYSGKTLLHSYCTGLWWWKHVTLITIHINGVKLLLPVAPTSYLLSHLQVSFNAEHCLEGSNSIHCPLKCLVLQYTVLFRSHLYGEHWQSVAVYLYVL